jgi:hypothetical protein
MRGSVYGLCMVGLTVAAVLVGQPSIAQNITNEFYFVANTRPPDAFLALRTHPSSTYGQRLAAMPNGTLLQVLQRRSDGWWQVRIVQSGQLGWALSGQHGKSWIDCCSAITGSIPAPTNSSAALYTPALNSPERNSILDAIRLAQRTDTRFTVHHLVVSRADNRAIAIADISDASLRTDIQGTFLLQSLNQQWRALYMVGGAGGSSECNEAKKIHAAMISEVNEFGSPKTIFPELFWKSLQEANASNQDGCSVAKRF